MSDPLRLDDLPELLTINEYAAFTRQGLTKAYEDCRSGRIRCIRLGRSVRIPRVALEELIYGKDEERVLRVVK